MYGEYTADELERMTHEEDPWNIARKGCDRRAVSNVIISNASMQKYYSKREDIKKQILM